MRLPTIKWKRVVNCLHETHCGGWTIDVFDGFLKIDAQPPAIKTMNDMGVDPDHIEWLRHREFSNYSIRDAKAWVVNTHHHVLQGGN